MHELFISIFDLYRAKFPFVSYLFQDKSPIHVAIRSLIVILKYSKYIRKDLKSHFIWMSLHKSV